MRTQHAQHNTAAKARSCTDPAQLDYLVRDSSTRIRAIAAASPSLSSDTVMRLALHEINADVCEALAANPAAAPYALECLQQRLVEFDPGRARRIAGKLLGNPNLDETAGRACCELLLEAADAVQPELTRAMLLWARRAGARDLRERLDEQIRRFPSRAIGVLRGAEKHPLPADVRKRLEAMIVAAAGELGSSELLIAADLPSAAVRDAVAPRLIGEPPAVAR